MAEVKQVIHANPDHFHKQKGEIVDFNVALDNYYTDENKIYGIKSYPRACDPAMREIISWRDCPGDVWNYKSNKEVLSRSSEFSRQNKKICREDNNFVSEAHDSYRKFIVGQGAPIFYDAPQQELKNVQTEFKSNYLRKSAQPQVIKEEPVKQETFLIKEESKNSRSQYEKDFSYKGIKNYRELQNQLLENSRQLNYENGPRNLNSDTYTRPHTALAAHSQCTDNKQKVHFPNDLSIPPCNQNPPVCGVQSTTSHNNFQSRYLTSSDHKAIQYSVYNGPKVSTYDPHQSTVRCSSPEENCKKAGFYRSRHVGAQYRYYPPLYSQDDMIQYKDCNRGRGNYDLSKSVDHGRFGEGIDGSHLYYVEPRAFQEKLVLNGGDLPGKNYEKDHKSYEPVFAANKGDSDDDLKRPGEEHYNNIKSRIFNTKNYKPYKQQVENFDNLDEETKRRRIERVKKFRDTSRWLPNSAMRTYFGKPPFECYGNANVKPPNGGFVYGDYLLTHNVNPHKQTNDPNTLQSYQTAIFTSYRQPPKKNEPPRKRLETNVHSKDQVDVLKSRSQIMPNPNFYETTKTNKPELVTSMRFASPENSPRSSVEKEKKIIKLSTQDRALAKSQKKKVTKDFVNTQFPANVPLKSSYLHQSGREVVITKEDIGKSFKQDHVQLSQKLSKKAKGKAINNNPQAGQEILQKQKILESQVPANIQSSALISGPVPGMGEATRNHSPMVNFETSMNPNILKPNNGNLAQGNYVPVSKYEPLKYQNQKQQRTPSVNQKLFGIDDEESGAGMELEYLNRIIDEREQKKSKRNRLAMKVTEVYPVRSIGNMRPNDEVYAPNNTLNEPHIDHSTKINPYQPPKNFLSTLSEQEMNPKNYKQVPPAFLDRIPYAGKFQTKSHDIKELF